MPVEVIGADQARRIALAAQGFGRRGRGPVTIRGVQRVVDQVAQFQLDSVNVTVRAQYMPLFARLGCYDRGLLERAAQQAPRRLFEFWGHAASLIDVQLEPALRFRMAEHAGQPWHRMRRLLEEQPELLEAVRRQVARGGPLTARQVDNPQQRGAGGWWEWSDVKTAMEWLFWIGELSSAGRTASFERRYDLAERVLPAPVRELPTPDVQQAHTILVGRAARALGLGTEQCLADYFRTDRARTRAAVTDLLRSGQLREVGVRGWSRPAYLWEGTPRPRRLTVDALVSPFDSLVFERRRLLELFGVHYRIGIYTPAAQRVHGYYVYLFVMDAAITARVDLKAERRGSGTLLVQSAWLEAGAPQAETAARLGAALRELADWLGLADLRVSGAGDLAPALARTLP